jgi:peptide/nickel transport system ATP-binding protein
MAAVPNTVPLASPDPDSADTIVQADGIAKYFDVSPPWLNRVLERSGRQILHAVDGVSFTIRRGETLSLVGESGCGKSTVARLLVGLYTPTRGRVEFFGHDLAEMNTSSGRSLRQKLQMIFQDPYASLNPRWRVRDIVGEPLIAHGLMRDRAQIAARVDELLLQVKLSPADKEKYPHQFSGGQPTSALDVSVQAQVLNLMKDLQRELGLTYLFISHNLAVVHHISDRVGVMYLGKIVELATRRTLFETPRHPYTRMLLDAIPDLEMSGRARTPVAGEVPNPLNPPSGCTFHPRCPHANARCKAEVPVLRLDRHAGGDTEVACHAVEEKRI